MINAAGIIFRSPEGRVLLLRRSDTEDWDYPGGKCRGDENPKQAAVREAYEETRYRAGHAGNFLCRRVRGGVDYTTFVYDCDDEFTPKLSKEHTDYMWVQPQRVLTDSIKAHRADAFSNWEEHKHPRGQPENKGQFGPGGGGAGGGAQGGGGQVSTKTAALPNTPEDIDPNAKVSLGTVHRGTEGTATRETGLRHFKGGDIGDGIYMTQSQKLAETYGGGPKASIKAGTRKVHAYGVKPLFPEEVAYVFGGAKHGEDTSLVSGNGIELWRGEWSGEAIEEALKKEGDGIKVVVGTPDSIGVNQIAIRDKSVLTDPEGARADAAFLQTQPTGGGGGLGGMAQWEEHKHPRGGDPENKGRFSAGHGAPAAPAQKAPAGPEPAEPQAKAPAAPAAEPAAKPAAPAEPGAPQGTPQATQQRPQEHLAAGNVDRNPNAVGAEHRVSTRVPTAATKKGETPIDWHAQQHLEPSLESLEATKESKKNMHGAVANIIRNEYQGFMRIPTGATDDQVVQGFVDHVKSNLLALYGAQKPEYRERSRKWYDGARKIAEDMAKKYGLSEKQCAGVIATQSPQKDWDSNVKLAKKICDVVSGPERHVKMEGELATKMTEQMQKYIKKCEQDIVDLTRKQETTGKSKAKSIQNAKDSIELVNKRLEQFQGKSFDDISKEVTEEDPNVQAWFLRFYEQATAPDRKFNIYTPEGEETDIRGKTETGKDASYSWSGFATIQNGIKAIEQPDDVSKHLGDQHKVRNFYNNIVSPDHGQDVTVDTHAIAAGLLQPLGSKSPIVGKGLGDGAGNADTGNSGLYSLYYTAYQQAAKEAGVKPREMQSIAWEALRGLYSPAQKRAKEKKAKQPKGGAEPEAPAEPTETPAPKHAEETWGAYANGSIDREEAQRRILGRGIQAPRWAAGGAA